MVGRHQRKSTAASGFSSVTQLVKSFSAQVLRIWRLQKASLTSPCSQPPGDSEKGKPAGPAALLSEAHKQGRTASSEVLALQALLPFSRKTKVTGRAEAGVSSWEHSGHRGWDYSHVLHHDVLVRHQPVDPVVPAFPPVLGRSVIQQQGGSLLEGQLSGRPPNVVKLGYGFYWLTFYREHTRKRWGTGLSWRHNTLSERSRLGLRNKEGRFHIQTEQGNKQIIKKEKRRC